MQRKYTVYPQDNICGHPINDFSNISDDYFSFIRKNKKWWTNGAKDLENRQPFLDCSESFMVNRKTLERVSVRGSMWSDEILVGSNRRTPFFVRYKIPQDVLVEFVRNAPNLRWFESDLTSDNIAKLRSEGYDHIEFV
jgi:hypothetical protein